MSEQRTAAHTREESSMHPSEGNVFTGVLWALAFDVAVLGVILATQL